MRSNRRPKACLILAALATLFLAGCRGTPSVAGLRWEIERQMPGIDLERESHLRLGRFTFGVLKRVALWAMDDDEEAREIVAHIRREDDTRCRDILRIEPEILCQMQSEGKSVCC